MSNRTWFAAGILVLLCTALASAGDRVRVQLLQGPGIAFPTTRPATPRRASTRPTTTPAEVLKDAKAAVCIETDVNSDGSFFAECIVGDKTIHLSGTVTPDSDGTCRVALDFSCRDSHWELESVGGTILVAPDRRQDMGCASDSDGKANLMTLELVRSNR
jgi:hypothetical protein